VREPGPDVSAIQCPRGVAAPAASAAAGTVTVRGFPPDPGPRAGSAARCPCGAPCGTCLPPTAPSPRPFVATGRFSVRGSV
jgi:hypothetical protein